MQVVAAPWGRSAVCSWAEPCSLAGAQEAVRRIDGNMHADIDVLLEGGTYDLTGPLSFGPQDSGTNGYTVTYGAAPGAHPVLSGAVAVTGWHEVDETSDIWAAPVAPGFDTTQLYVDGRQVPRSSGLPSATYIQSTTGFTTTSPVLANWTNVTERLGRVRGRQRRLDPDVVPRRVGGRQHHHHGRALLGQPAPAGRRQPGGGLGRRPAGRLRRAVRSGPTVLLRERRTSC